MVTKYTNYQKLSTDISQIIQDKTLTEKELTDFDKGFEAVELPQGEIWIGKKDLLPYKSHYAQ
jgi:hypothetical protein